MLKEKIKALVAQGEEGDNKKKIENLVVFVIILIVTIVAINLIWGGNETNSEDGNDSNKKLAMHNEKTETSSNENELSTQLEDILEQIQGVGNVKVLITYSETSQTIPMYNEETSQKDTQEQDTNGGTRKVIETDVKKDVIYEETNGEKTPITQSIVSPRIEGAIVTAEGANDVNIKANIIQAVEAVTRNFYTQNSGV